MGVRSTSVNYAEMMFAKIIKLVAEMIFAESSSRSNKLAAN
jgi:hypothetical protein